MFIWILVDCSTFLSILNSCNDRLDVCDHFHLNLLPFFSSTKQINFIDILINFEDVVFFSYFKLNYFSKSLVFLYFIL
jgi:hypothetical protein